MAIYDFAEDAHPDTGRRPALLVEEDFSWSEAPDRPLKGKFGEVTARRGKVPAARIIRSSSSRLDSAVRYRESRAGEELSSESPLARRHGARVDHVDGGQTRHDRSLEDRRHPARVPDRDPEQTGNYVVLRRGGDLYDPEDELDAERAGLLSRIDLSPRQLERYALWTFLLVLALFLGTAGTGHAAVLSQLPR